VFDIPDLHMPNKQSSIDFMNALAFSEDISLFSSKAIQLIILERWKHIKPVLYLGKLLPYIVYFFAFQVWTIYTIPYLEDGQGYRTANMYLLILLTLLSLFFILTALRLLYRLSTSYDAGYKIFFKSIWNYFDLTPPILMLIYIGTSIKSIQS